MSVNETGKFTRLIQVLVGVQLAIYGLIAWLSPHFDFYAAVSARPLLTVIGLLLVNFALHCWSLSLLLKCPDTSRLGWRIVFVGLLMRAILIGSTPIQEVDIYRYIWDGAVLSQGISPFRYPPLMIADEKRPTDEPDAIQLREMIADDPGIWEVLQRVHYPELPTVYPPASQFVFAAAALVTPEQSSVGVRLLVMKFWIVAFDVAALGCIWLLLSRLGKHSAWLVAWAWSPLVLKEFANSGHLDSIAVFFTLSATCVIVRRSSRWNMHLSGLLIGLAVASKLYPVVLLPLLIIVAVKRSSWSRGIQLGCVAVVSIFVLLLPMFWSRVAVKPPASVVASSGLKQGSLHGLSTFLTRWEMNDLLFMVVEENIRPAGAVPDQPALWFVVVPNLWRQAITKQLAIVSGQAEDRVPFLATRTLSVAVFAALMLWLACRAWQAPDQVPRWLFLALAWFWFLSPTQNPWYWCWALAFIPFAGRRLWMAVSGLSLLYYLRFWFLYHSANMEILGTGYRGAQFFDFVVVWIEFGPLLVLLAISGCRAARVENETSRTAVAH